VAALLFLAVLNHRLTRESAATAQAAANRSYGFTDAVARYAAPVRAIGMGTRWPYTGTSTARS
jgi:ATP-binding cassette, subfamily C, bacterial exporter for protease/lipase